LSFHLQSLLVLQTLAFLLLHSAHVTLVLKSPRLLSKSQFLLLIYLLLQLLSTPLLFLHTPDKTIDIKVDKYPDTLLASQPISAGEATDHCQKVAPQDGRLPELIVARSCLTNHS